MSFRLERRSGDSIAVLANCSLLDCRQLASVVFVCHTNVQLCLLFGSSINNPNALFSALRLLQFILRTRSKNLYERESWNDSRNVFITFTRGFALQGDVAFCVFAMQSDKSAKEAEKIRCNLTGGWEWTAALSDERVENYEPSGNSSLNLTSDCVETWKTHYDTWSFDEISPLCRLSTRSFWMKLREGRSWKFSAGMHEIKFREFVSGWRSSRRRRRRHWRIMFDDNYDHEVCAQGDEEWQHMLTWCS